MSDSALTQGRTRWRRFAIAMVPATVIIGGLVVGMANGAVAASFSVSGQQFKVSADNLHGTGFRQYSAHDDKADGTPIPVAGSVIDNASLTNLCQSVNVPNPFGIPIVLRIEAGGGGNPATATGLTIGLTKLQGNATFTNIQIGRDGGEVSGNPALKGSFAQSADEVNIDGLRQTATSTSAGTFNLTGLTLAVLTGGDAKECF
jgi:Family of unknown function (DUF6230)